MSDREILLVIVCLLIGVSIGYVASNIIREQISSYIFPTEIYISTDNNMTTVIVGTEVTFTASLNVVLPSELESSVPQIRQYLLQNKDIVFYMCKVDVNSTSTTHEWYIIGSERTVFINNVGQVSITYTFEVPGTYIVKAKFDGTNLLLESESNELQITVT